MAEERRLTTDELEETEMLAGPLPEAEPSLRHPVLLVLTGESAGRLVRLDRDELTIGRAPGVDLQLNDRGISREHVRLVKAADGTIMLSDLGSTNGTYLGEEAVLTGRLKRGDRIRLGTLVVLKFDYHDPIEEQLQSRLYENATRDGLTGAFNKRYFLQRLQQEALHARRYRQPLCLVLLDADHFKAVNDTYGHAAGDKVLVDLATRVGRHVRGDDVFARWGGEEFSLLLRRADGEQALALAERVRSEIELEPFSVPTTAGRAQVAMTASLGVAQLDEQGDEDSLFVQADAALYRAKTEGRNRVILFR